MDPQFDGVIFQTHSAELHTAVCTIPSPPSRSSTPARTTRFRRGHLPGALLASGQDLAAVLAKETGRIEIFVVGNLPGDPRVREVSLALLQLGAHRIVELTGGMLEWKRSGHEMDFERAA